MKHLSILFFILFISLNSFAQRPGGGDFANKREASITGIVIEENTKKPMEYVNIAIYSLRDSSLVDGGITNPQGVFSITELPYGKFYVIINFIGFEKKIIQGVFLNPRQASLDLGEITLKSDWKLLEGVEVVADKDPVEFKIDKKIINVGQDIVSAGGSAVDALENAPSVQVDIEGNITMRGTSNFLVLIDGKPSVLQGSDALEQIPAAAIESIEIITNPSAKYDPDGMGGIINVIMKKKMSSGFSGIANATVGTGDKYRADILLSYRMKKINFFAGFDYRDDTRYGTVNNINKSFNNEDSTFVTETKGDRNRISSGYTIKGGFDLDISPKTVISLSANYGSKNRERDVISTLKYFYEDYIGTEEYYSNSSISESTSNYYSSNLNFQHKFAGKNHQINSMIHFSSSQGDDIETQDEFLTDALFNPLAVNPSNSIYSIDADESMNIKITTDYKRPLSEKYLLETGLQFRMDDNNDIFTFNTKDSITNTWIKDSTYSGNMDFKRNIYSAYATLLKEDSIFSWMIGLRTEYTDRTIISKNNTYTIQRPDFFPTAHISFQLPKKYQLMMSYSRRIQRPGGWTLDPFPTYINAYNVRIGNPSIEPEYANSFEISTIKRINRSFINASIYYRNSQNIITRVRNLENDSSNVMVHTFENLDKDHSIGMEIMGNIYVTKWYSFNISGNYYYYKIEGDIIEEGAVTTSQNYDLRMNNTFKIKTGTRIQLTGMYYSPSITAQGERSGFFYTNMAVKQDFFNRSFSATLQVRNILGTAKHQFDSYGASFEGHTEFIPESPVFMLSLSYKWNNFKKQKFENKGDFNQGGGDADDMGL